MAPEHKVFFWVCRKIYPVSRNVLRDVANQYHYWVEHSAAKWGTEIVGNPEGRRDDFVEPYFGNAQPDQVVVIIRTRELKTLVPETKGVPLEQIQKQLGIE